MKKPLLRTLVIAAWLIMVGWLVRYEAFPERFGGADSLLVSSLEFTKAEGPEAVEPVAADSPGDTD